MLTQGFEDNLSAESEKQRVLNEARNQPLTTYPVASRTRIDAY